MVDMQNRDPLRWRFGPLNRPSQDAACLEDGQLSEGEDEGDLVGLQQRGREDERQLTIHFQRGLLQNDAIRVMGFSFGLQID
jgi:hypothetical protein